MSQIKSIEAIRPIDGSEWLDSVENMALESFGADLDFHHEALRELELVLLGEEEWIRMHKIAGVLGGLSAEHAAEVTALAHHKLPDSFDSKATLKPFKIDVEKRDTSESIERVLVVKVGSKPVKRERKSLTKTIDEVFGHNHPWDKVPSQFDLAVIIDGFMCNKNLAELRAALPQEVRAGPGKIKPVPVELLPSKP
ncbi:MAG TPA: hypothetical protein VD947_00540 [Patescibacteria group bacterium]|nr:hypothetical protein [Patescibacteria group bacterium]